MITRRHFLRQTLLGGMGAAAATSAQLALVRSALAQSSSVHSDYRALVCVFLYGGNDSWNMLLPQSGNALSDYQSARLSLAVSGGQAISLQQEVEGGLVLHPSLEPLRGLFADGSLAVQTNVGPLWTPTTLD